MKRLNPTCIHCGRQISKDSITRGDGRVLEQANGVRRGEHVVADCAEKSLKQIREEVAALKSDPFSLNAVVAQG